MKKCINVTVILTITLFCLAKPIEAKTPTCRISLTLQSGGIAYGSGTAYHKDGSGVYVLTCKHIIRDATRVAVATKPLSNRQYDCPNGACPIVQPYQPYQPNNYAQPYQPNVRTIYYVPITADFEHGSYKAWIFASHPTEDLALAYIPKRGLKTNFFVTPISNRTPNPGEQCFSQGHPFGREVVTIKGTILPNNGLSYPLQQGMSGGGVFQRNRIVGVGVATDETSGLFVPAHIIRDFTNRAYTFHLVEGPITLEAVGPQGEETQGDKESEEPEENEESDKGPEVPQPRPAEPKPRPAEPKPSPVTPSPDAPSSVTPSPDVNLQGHLDKIDKLEKTIKVVSTVANYAIPGAGIAGTLIGTGLGFVLRRRAKRRSSAPQVQGTTPPASQGPQGTQGAQQPDYSYVQVQPQPFPVVLSPTPPQQVIHTETYPTPVEVDKFSRRFAWAKAQLMQKEPGSIGTIERIEGLMRQCKEGKRTVALVFWGKLVQCT